MDKIAKIRQEIERRKNICEGVFERESDTYYQGKAVAYGELLTFLDTFSEEPDKSLEEEIKNYFQGYWPGTDTAEQCNTDLHFTPPAIMRLARHFVKWGAKHTPLPEDTVLFQKGVEEGKRLMMEEWLKDRDGCFWDGVNEGKKAMEEQMMKEAVEGEITKDNRGNNVVRAGVFNKDFEYGDKVRIIIVKED